MSATGSENDQLASTLSCRDLEPKTKKRPHTKSRNGCLTCKQRRVKVSFDSWYAFGSDILLTTYRF
jgi:hypothetical protein